MSSAPFLLLRIPSLKLRVRGRKEAFEANLKTETELWNLMVKEMWAGRDMADQHKVAPNESFLCEITWRAAILFVFFLFAGPPVHAAGSDQCLAHGRGSGQPSEQQGHVRRI